MATIILALAAVVAVLFATDLADAPATPVKLMNGEKLMSFTAIAPQVPGHRGNSHANSSTLFRWATKGVKAANGQTIRLEAVRIGSAWKTSQESVARFAAALTAASLPATDAATETAPTPKQQSRAAARASKELDVLLGSSEPSGSSA